MRREDIPGLLRFLKANGVWVELGEDAEETWAYVLRNFDGRAVKAGCLWFLERNHPREVSPATIAAAVRSLIASGRFHEEMCPDHPEETARACRCCAADVLTGHRPRELAGQSLHTGPRALVSISGTVERPMDLRQVDPARWDALYAQGAASSSVAPGEAS